ncbi:MAG: DUF2461 domain-containing protein [Bacteroidota bacterium]
MISREFIQFFQELDRNNNKAWFHQHKSAYESFVKQPFEQIVQKVLDELNSIESGYPIQAKETLFRINRDVRFSSDKRPYHTMIKASIVRGGKKSAMPGFYLAADAQALKIGGGLRMIQPKNLKYVRQFVSKHIDELLAITEQTTFKKHYPEVLGERYKTQDLMARNSTTPSPYLLNKQFYVMKDYPINDYLDQDLTSFIMQHVEILRPFNGLLQRAISH